MFICRYKKGDEMELEKSKIIDQLASTFSLLGEPLRLAIVVYLLNKKANVSEITDYVNVSQPAVSHHLRLLKATSILKSEKKGKLVYYSISDEHIKNIIELGLVHMLHGN